MGIDTELVERARQLRAGPLRAEVLVELARVGLGDLRACERHGGDGLGTDAYEVVRDGWPDYLALLDHSDVELRMAAAYLLSFLIEQHAETLLMLQVAAACETAEVPRAAMIVAAARLETTGAALRGEHRQVPWDGLELTAEARAASPLIRAALVICDVFSMPRSPRKGRPEVGEALEAVPSDVAVGPWGGGDFSVLARELRASIWVESGAATPGLVPAAQPETGFGDDEVANPYLQGHPEGPPPRIELPGLHDVAWDAFEDAYGSADGVPAMIEALTSADRPTCEWGLNGLDASIHHQGTVDPVCEMAAPFLIKLAAHPDVHAREELLVLLCGLAVSNPSWCLDEGAAEHTRSVAFDAVCAGGPVFVDLLRDPDARVRTAAALVLSFVIPPAGALEALRAALAAERDRRTRSSLLLAIGYTSRMLESRADRALLTGWLGDPAPVLRVSAAIALVMLDGRDAGAEVRAILDEARQRGSRVIGFWPWCDGDLQVYARTMRRSIQTDDELLADVVAATAAGDRMLFTAAAERVLPALFRDGRHDADHPWLPDELDHRQRTLLAAYLSFHVDQPGSHNLLPDYTTLAYVGLPDARDTMRRFLGVTSGPVDHRLEVAGVTRPAWAHILGTLLGQVARADLLAAIASLDPEARVALVEDGLESRWLLYGPNRGDDVARGTTEPSAGSTSLLIELMAAVLVGAGDGGLAWADQTVATQTGLAYRHQVRCTIAALILARDAASRGLAPPPAVLSMLGADRPPTATFEHAEREVLALLPVEPRLELLAHRVLYTYTAYLDPRGEVRRWRNGDGWRYLELLPPTLAAAQILAAAREWQRHRAAGDDPHATPVAGSVTSSLDNKPSPDEPFPVERARAVLVAAGVDPATLVT